MRSAWKITACIGGVEASTDFRGSHNKCITQVAQVPYIVGILGNRTAVHNHGVGRLSVAMAETSPEIGLRSELEIIGPIGDSPLTLCPS